MLSAEQNELLTRIGPGSRMGALLRRYWHPIAPLVDLEERDTKAIRLLGEDLLLVRNRQGELGLRGTAYPVRAFAGLYWAYLGPLPAPAIPPLDGLVATGTIRFVGRATIKCNWLQIMENSVDPVHTEWLHGKLTEFVREHENFRTSRAKHHVKIAFDEAPYGIVKRRLMEGQTEDASDWRDGHPVVFPLTLAVGTRSATWRQYQFQIRVPVDDETTEHYWYSAYVPPRHVDVPPHLLERVPVYDVQLRDETGEYRVDYINAQDALAWETQGRIADRTVEHLGTTDKGVMLLRKMLLRELDKVEAGRDPMGVYRGAAAERVVELPGEYQKDMQSDGFQQNFIAGNGRFSPVRDEVLALFEGVLV